MKISSSDSEGLATQESATQMFRYHCHRCSTLTLAPKEQETVACRSCGTTISSARLLDEWRRVYGEQAALGLAVSRVYDPRVCDPRVCDPRVCDLKVTEYARVDAELAFLLTTLPLELALEKRRQRVYDPRLS